MPTDILMLNKPYRLNMFFFLAALDYLRNVWNLKNRVLSFSSGCQDMHFCHFPHCIAIRVSMNPLGNNTKVPVTAGIADCTLYCFC